MNLELAITQLAEAVKENTAALREILSVGSITATETPAPKKGRASKTAPLTVVETAVKEDLTPEPAPEEPAMPTAEPEPETPEVPDLPVAELRNSLKEVIKGKLLADTEGVIKPIFDALRAKYGVAVIKELTDDQVEAFYGEVLAWG